MEFARRRFYAHPAHASIGVSIVAEALRQPGRSASRRGEVQRSLLRVLWVAPPLDEEWEESLWALKEHLERRRDCTCARAFSQLETLPRESLDRYDCLVLLIHSGSDAATWRPAVERCTRQGKGVVLIGMDGEGLLGPVVAHMAPGAETHPILHYGPPALRVCGPPPVPQVPADAQVVLTGAYGPAAWSWERGEGRAFFLVLGCAVGLAQFGFRRLLQGALEWTAARR